MATDWLSSSSISILVSVSIIFWFFGYDPRPELDDIPQASTFVRTGLWLNLQELRGKETAAIHSLHEELGPMVRLSRNAVSIATDSPQLRSIHNRVGLAQKSSQYEDLPITHHRPLFGLRDAQEHAARRAGFGNTYTSGLNGFKIDRRLLVAQLEIMDGQIVDTIDIFWDSLIECTQQFLFGCAQDRPPLASYEDIRLRRDGESIGHGSPIERLRMISLFPGAISQRLRSLTRRTQAAKWAGLGCMVAAEQKTDVPCWRILQHLTSELQSANANSQLSPEQENYLRERVCDEMIDQLTGGIDFPLAALTCALALLGKPENTGWQKSIREDGEETASAVLHEVLRLYPPAAGSQPRELLQATAFHYKTATIVLQPGVVVHAQPFTLHRDPHVFPEPLVFRPERWLPGGGARISDLWAFGKGPTHCIAQGYAMKVMKRMLKSVCDEVEFASASDINVSDGLLLSPGAAKVHVYRLPPPFQVA